MSAKYQRHSYEEKHHRRSSISESEEDDDDQIEDPYTQSDLEIAREHSPRRRYHKKSYRGKHKKSKRKHNERKRKRSPSPYLIDWDAMINSDDDASSNQSDDDVQGANKLRTLLLTPLSAEERLKYTTNGITVRLRFKRSKCDDKYSRVNIVRWSLDNVVQQYEDILSRYGFTWKQFTPSACWEIDHKGTTTEYSLGWSDLLDLSIPYNRRGFHILLEKKPHCPVKQATTEKRTEPQPPRRKKNKRDCVHQQNRTSAVQTLKKQMDENTVRWMNENMTQKHWEQLARFYSEKGWRIGECQSFIRTNYMAKKDAVDQAHAATLNLPPIPSKKEMLAICREIQSKPKTDYVAASPSSSSSVEILSQNSASSQRNSQIALELQDKVLEPLSRNTNILNIDHDESTNSTQSNLVSITQEQLEKYQAAQQQLSEIQDKEDESKEVEAD